MTLGKVVRPWLFPLVVLSLYGLGLVYAPEKTNRAISISLSMFRHLALPIGVALLMMMAVNLVLSPTLVARYLGRGAGIKGVLLATLAGVFSMGPVYAWYPLCKALREKGASVFNIATFINTRSIKPVLIPVMVAYFGWRFTLEFVVLSLAGALMAAWVVSVLASGPKRD